MTSSMMSRLTVSGAALLLVGTALLPSMAASGASMVVETGKAMINGRKETVLTNAKGMTLYYDSKDSAHKVTCTGSCAKYWPPLLLASGAPTGPSGIQKGLSTFKGPLGRQVEFRGHPLYRFLRDKKPGQAKGQGLANHRWNVVTPGTMPVGSGG